MVTMRTLLCKLCKCNTGNMDSLFYTCSKLMQTREKIGTVKDEKMYTTYIKFLTRVGSIGQLLGPTIDDFAHNCVSSLNKQNKESSGPRGSL